MQQHVKCEIVGDGAVGKTCFLISYTTNKFPGEYLPTTFDNYATNLMIDGQVLHLNLWDTPGQDDFETQRAEYYTDTDVFIMCFAIDNRDSFLNIKDKWYPEIRQHCPDAPIILVGMKEDLRSQVLSDDDASSTGSQNSNLITKMEGLGLSSEIRAAKYIECSALNKSGLDEVFREVALVFKEKQLPPPPPTWCRIS